MIQYDRDMSADDLVAYWHHGYVIVKHEATGEYTLASVVGADRHTVVVLSKRVKTAMTRDQFFRDVILHRPYVNLVEKDGVIYRLMWTPPERDARRHISPDMLEIHRLNPPLTLSPGTLKKLVKWQQGFLDMDQEKRYVGPNFAPTAESDDTKFSLNLLVHSLNSELPVSMRQQIWNVFSMPVGSGLLLNMDEYVYHKKPDTASIHAGRTRLCWVTRGKTKLWCEPDSGISPASCWWRRVQQIITIVTDSSTGETLHEHP